MTHHPSPILPTMTHCTFSLPIGFFWVENIMGASPKLSNIIVTGYKSGKSKQMVINVTSEGSLGPRAPKLGQRVNCGR